jgi:hypothetical protein
MRPNLRAQARTPASGRYPRFTVVVGEEKTLPSGVSGPRQRARRRNHPSSVKGIVVMVESRRKPVVGPPSHALGLLGRASLQFPHPSTR